MSSETIHSASQLTGTLHVPGDKSISHRALILGALCQGRVEIQHLLVAEDVSRTEAILRQLGVSIHEEGDHWIVTGKGREGLQGAPDPLYCGNSGTTLRLMTGLLAGLPFKSILTGDASLNRRPMERVLTPLRQMGGEIAERQEGEERWIEVEGKTLAGVDYESPLASAQVKSAILLAGLFAQGGVNIREPHPSRDHTERMLTYLGANLEWGPGWVKLQPGRGLEAKPITVPGDFSSAAFFIVAALLVPNSEVRLENILLNPTRTGLLSVLSEMGGHITIEKEREVSGELVGDLIVRSSSLQGISVGAERIPALIDEIPILAIAAAHATGETVIQGAWELRVKESDRLSAMATELPKLGGSIEELPDGLKIVGTQALSGGTVQSHGDHRIAMALAVSGLTTDTPVTIDGFDCVAISYPHFLDDLRSLT